MAVENIVLNLIPTGDTPSIHVAQFDVNRPFTVTLKEGEDDFTPTGYDIELQVRKVDSNIVTAIPTSTSGNIVTFNTTEQMTACSGTNIAELELTKDSQTFATLHFYIVVQRDVLAGGLTSQSEIYDLEDQIAAIVPEVIGDEYYTAEEVDEKIAEIPTFDPTNYYTKSQLYTKTETNGLLSAKANTSALSTVAFSGSYTDLTNKPTIPDVSNYYTKSETYNQTEVNNLLSTKADTSSLSAVATSGSYNDLLNKPTIPAAQVQSDWLQSDNTKVDYIKNKPTIPTDAKQLPITSGSATNTKDYIDSKTPINKGGHATDLSTTGLITGTYLYNYDSTTNGIPKANTEGDCYITINNTQSYGCELAVSNSGLFWRKKENQVWGSWVDIISKLAVDSAESSGIVGVNGTWQIPTAVLNHTLVIVSIRRQGLGNSAIFSVDDLKARDNGFMLASSPTQYGILKCDSNGVLTVLTLNNMNDVFIRATGIF